MSDQSSVYTRLADSVRRLVDVTIRTEAPPAVVISATTRIDELNRRLGSTMMPGPFGTRDTTDGQSRASGNVVIGVRNPVALPLVLHHVPEERSVWAEFVLGAAYEGPPGHVHGGVCAMLLDHVLGATAHLPGRPAYTGTLTTKYLAPTRLNWPLRAEARVEKIDGVKTFVVGHLADVSGVTVAAEGIFIHPRAQEH